MRLVPLPAGHPGPGSPIACCHPRQAALSSAAMEPLPFSLRVSGIDTFAMDAIASTAFSFKGRLTLDPDDLCLEWTGSAHVDEVAFTGIRSEQIALPRESLRLPYCLLGTVQLRGGWLRPCIELTGTDWNTLQSVPSEDAGHLRLWIARRNRPLARRVVTVLRQAMARPVAGPRPLPPQVVSDSTPPEGSG